MRYVLIFLVFGIGCSPGLEKRIRSLEQIQNQNLIAMQAMDDAHTETIYELIQDRDNLTQTVAELWVKDHPNLPQTSQEIVDVYFRFKPLIDRYIDDKSPSSWDESLGEMVREWYGGMLK